MFWFIFIPLYIAGLLALARLVMGLWAGTLNSYEFKRWGQAWKGKEFYPSETVMRHEKEIREIMEHLKSSSSK